MNYLTSFEQDIILPATVTHVDGDFLYCTDGMYNGGKTLNIGNIPGTSFAIGNTVATITDITGTAGITIVGSDKETFMAKFQNSDVTPFRKLV
jgi:hypothetical protein